uniref:Uncharacterized protein n=1 Tax=Lepeophtheirus salmonis TaxID=72036 RepID=A0A0K2TJN6_LEPSM
MKELHPNMAQSSTKTTYLQIKGYVFRQIKACQNFMERVESLTLQERTEDMMNKKTELKTITKDFL